VAQQIINDGSLPASAADFAHLPESYADFKRKVQANFTELYGLSSSTPNLVNGRTVSLGPQDVTGLNALASSAVMDFAVSGFTGNRLGDPVAAFGVNVSAGSSVLDTSRDTMSNGIFFEANYESQYDTGNSTGGTSATLVDSGKSWAPNVYARWTLHNVTTGGRALITSNTGAVITIAGSMVAADGITAAPANAAGHSYKILRRDHEQYIQVAMNNGANSSVRPWMIVMDRGTSEATGVLTAVSSDYRALGGNGFMIKDINNGGVIQFGAGFGVQQLSRADTGGSLFKMKAGAGLSSSFVFEGNNKQAAFMGSSDVSSWNLYVYNSSGAAAHSQIQAGYDTLGFLGAPPVAKQVITGAKSGNAALASVIALLVSFGFATDSTT
jgi:hypothetical protein